MSMLEILTYPDLRLKQVANEVTAFDAELKEFLVKLEQTMRAGPGGVGIAAPQVGRLSRIVIIDVSDKPKVESNGCMVLVNPEIIQWEGMVVGREGCMSVPDYTGNVIRAEKITVKAFDVKGKIQEFQCSGFEARAVQHEIDHLDGLLFLDRLVSSKKDLFRRKKYK